MCSNGLKKQTLVFKNEALIPREPLRPGVMCIVPVSWSFLYLLWPFSPTWIDLSDWFCYSPRVLGRAQLLVVPVVDTLLKLACWCCWFLTARDQAFSWPDMYMRLCLSLLTCLIVMNFFLQRSCYIMYLCLVEGLHHCYLRILDYMFYPCGLCLILYYPFLVLKF